MRTVVYARFSSKNQREESISAQLRACQVYADNSGLNIIDVYADRVKSAKSADRPEFQKLITDGQLGKFDVVLVHKLDRFSRNVEDTLHYERLLKESNVELVSVMEKLDSSPSGEFMKTIIAAVNRYHSANLAVETMKGHIENAHQGMSTGGRPPLGYSVDENKKYILNPMEMQSVKMIFELYDSGCGYSEILDTLNNLNYKTRLGNKFGKNSLYDLLRNEKYTGTMIYNKSSKESMRGTFNRHKHKDTSAITKCEGAIPAIIDKELFERVQTKMNSNKRKQAQYKAKIEYILSGLVYCGKCKSHLVGSMHRYRDHEYAYYVCTTRKNKRTCDKTNTRKDIIEQQIIDYFESLFADNIPKIAESIYNMQIKFNKSTPSQRDEVKGMIAEVDRQLSNIISGIAIAGTENASLFKEKLDSLSKEKGRLLAKYNVLDKTDKAFSRTKEEIAEYFEQYKSFKKQPAHIQKDIIRNMVRRIYVYEDYFDIYYWFDDEERLDELDAFDSMILNDGISDTTDTNSLRHLYPKKAEFIVICNIPFLFNRIKHKEVRT